MLGTLAFSIFKSLLRRSCLEEGRGIDDGPLSARRFSSLPPGLGRKVLVRERLDLIDPYCHLGWMRVHGYVGVYLHSIACLEKMRPEFFLHKFNQM